METTREAEINSTHKTPNQLLRSHSYAVQFIFFYYPAAVAVERPVQSPSVCLCNEVANYLPCDMLRFRKQHSHSCCAPSDSCSYLIGGGGGLADILLVIIPSAGRLARIMDTSLYQ